MFKQLLIAAVMLPVVATSAVIADDVPALAAASISVSLRAAVSHLPVARETRAGYQRDKFKLWIDANGDCQDTRAEVLLKESKTSTTGACSIRTGKWFSFYDHRTFTQASDLDIDHVVPLAEAWDSGARRWNAGTRRRYANDLGDPRVLVAVSASSNRSKSDRDPNEWMPTFGQCRYVKQWVVVKLRWSMKVDRAEKRALVRRAARCPDSVLRVHKATVRTRPAVGAGSGKTVNDGGHQSGGTKSGLDPRFPYCYQAVAAGYGPYTSGRDPEYAWYTDSDRDGVVCE